MQHSTKEGEPKLVAECTYPLTARRVVHRVITELAVLDCTPSGFRLVELAPGVPRAQVAAATGAPLS
jgi:3-oxoacid CoA-transferase subunit B